MEVGVWLEVKVPPLTSTSTKPSVARVGDECLPQCTHFYSLVLKLQLTVLPFQSLITSYLRPRQDLSLPLWTWPSDLRPSLILGSYKPSTHCRSPPFFTGPPENAPPTLSDIACDRTMSLTSSCWTSHTMTGKRREVSSSSMYPYDHSSFDPLAKLSTLPSQSPSLLF
ncbi:hypothetical protein Hypma_009422 [Hypsizygus marmoreus]|uniref:Uncharacterized protein n=1 Tax=Hypsizygus marmoreus TaxID=39966 RepID=A0A369JSE8_HYPMA|nr:hypothetical protein Hypma_009422 [Hypsizygus marmoreus]